MRNQFLPTLSILAVAALCLSVPAAHAQPPEDGGNPFWQRLSSRLDLDGDGTITRQEFEQGEDRFARLDHNADGVLTESDFEGFQGRPGRGFRGRGPGGGAMIFGADVDRSGEVTAEEWQTFLSALDSNSDGVLADDEIDAHHQAMAAQRGWAGGPPAEARARMLRVLDRDGDGVLETADLQAAFDAADGNGDGSLDASEMPRRGRDRHRRMAGGFLARQADVDGDQVLTEGEWQGFVTGLDGDGDGVISGEEMAVAAQASRRGPRGPQGLEVPNLLAWFGQLDRDGDGVVQGEEWPQPGRGRGPGRARF